jgi:hypothetical protein
LRSRPARDAIQFTLDTDALNSSNVVKNKSKAEMDTDKRLRKKRAHAEATQNDVKVHESIDLNKKRKTSETAPVQEKIAPSEKKAGEKEEEKPWEGKKEEEEDYRWNICENCQ